MSTRFITSVVSRARSVRRTEMIHRSGPETLSQWKEGARKKDERWACFQYPLCLIDTKGTDTAEGLAGTNILVQDVNESQRCSRDRQSAGRWEGSAKMQ